MYIGELSLKSGLSRDTIRWYEKEGLLNSEEIHREANNYRVFNQSTLRRLTFIDQCKSFGFSLHEIKDLLHLKEKERLHCEVVSPVLQNKIKEIDQKLLQLQRIKTKLTQLMENCSGNCENYLLK